MNYEESLKLERYRYVQDRISYHSDMAQRAFFIYVIWFVVLSLSAFYSVMLKDQGRLSETVWTAIMVGIGLVEFIIAAGSMMLIHFSAGRWRTYREAECKLNPDTPAPMPTSTVIFYSLLALILLSAIITWGFEAYVMQAVPTTLQLPRAR